MKYLFPIFYMIELLVGNPACVHCLVTEQILESFEHFNGSLPFVVDPEGTGISNILSAWLLGAL